MKDIEITGQAGFYQLRAGTKAGRRFMRREVQGFGFAEGTVWSDDTRMTQDIADGAVKAGLTVEVNGAAYEGQVS